MVVAENEKRPELDQAIQDGKKGMVAVGNITMTTLEEKSVEDEWFKVIERLVECDDLLKSYLVELQIREQDKVPEDRRNRLECSQLLETYSLIKANIQWRKIKDWLKDDERCLRLEKCDHIEIFQEYICDLEHWRM